MSKTQDQQADRLQDNRSTEAQETKDTLTDCPKCGGRGWVVEPGLTGIVFSMPCPVCNGEAA